ncbi:hypothetical protein [Bacillus sp. 165]|nr:hypothetical protein [Bacillus sp. 165]MBO9130531.1 hypothetical protein [Bacillus sp. 165]
MDKEQHKQMEQEEHPLVEPKAKENVKTIVWVGFIALIAIFIQFLFFYM